MGGAAHKIPGYGAYSRRESLREDDRLLRDYVADSIADKRSEISEEIRNADLNDVALLKKRADALLILDEEIRFSAYGYSPLFSDRKITEEDLVRIRDADAEMVKIVESGGECLINDLRELLRRREEIMRSIGVDDV